MEQDRKKMKFEILIDRYFSNFFQIVLTNLIFFVPIAVLLASYYFLSLVVSKAVSSVVLVAVVSLLFAFYSGVVLVVRNFAKGDIDVEVFATFIKGIKENFLKFLLYGFLFSLAVVVSYYSINMYIALRTTSWLVYVMLFLCILVSLCLFYTFFYIPQMTVTFDLSVKHILKNSFLMSFGELKNNFFATLALIVVLAILMTFTIFCTTVPTLIIVLCCIVALFLPATCQFVVSFFTYDGMYSLITAKNEKKEKIDNRIENVKNKRDLDYVEQVMEDYSDVDISMLKDTDDYIFYKGKMIKQSVLLKKALEYKQHLKDNADKEV